MMTMKQRLNNIADAVIKELSGKVIIHRYDSYSTNSIYLKFDYGVANSLRISDHDGKKYLKYRYNIVTTMSDRSSKKECRRGGFQMIFYSPAMIKACCRDILAAKAEKKQKYKSYEAVVNAAKEKSVGKRGFWSGAKMVWRAEMNKPDIFVDVTCPQCGCTAGNGGCGDVFSCPYCGWRGEIDGVSDDVMTVEEILQQHRQRNREGNV